MTLNGKLSYTVPITIEGPFSDAMNDPDMMDDYLSAQQAVIDIINDAARQYNAENASEDEKLAAIETVMNFFVYDKTIFDIDAVIAQQLLEDINDLPNDRKTAFAKRLLSSNPTFTFGSLEDITEAEKAMVLEYTVEEVCKVSDTAELEANLKNNNDILKLPLDNKYYKELTDDVLRRMINIDFANSGDLKKQFADNYVMVAFNAAGISKTYLVNVISDCEEEIGYDAEKFNKRSDTEKEALAKALIDGKDSITDIKQLRDAIDGYDKKEEPTPTKKPSSSSSGGGGGGSVKVPYTKPVIENQNKPDTEPADETTDEANGEPTDETEGEANGEGDIEPPEAVFNDCPFDAWYYKYVKSAKDNNIVTGDDDNRINPQAPITREECAVILNRVITQKGIALARVNELVRFNDSGNISPWASYAVSELQVMGVLNGDNGMIYPKNSTTRAETAKMISEILNKSKEAAVSE